MWLVAGLGNPGAKYERNRHNIGFLAADALAEKAGASPWGKKFQGLVCEARLAPAATRVFLLKPQTFMNLSGESVAAAARFYKIPPERIIVLQDELDIPAGSVRIKQGGGSGGHNGIKSIDAHLGPDYWRLRIGIGHPGGKHDVSNYVLNDFPKAEWEIQEKVIDGVATHFGLLLAGDASEFVRKVAAIAPRAAISSSPGLPPPSQPSPVKGEGVTDTLVFLPPLRGRAREGGAHPTPRRRQPHDSSRPQIAQHDDRRRAETLVLPPPRKSRRP